MAQRYEFLVNSSMLKIAYRLKSLSRIYESIYANSEHNLPHISLFILKDLSTCSHVSIRKDIVRKSLDISHNGLFEVVNISDRLFTINIDERVINISTERFKPAYLTNNIKTS